MNTSQPPVLSLLSLSRMESQSPADGNEVADKRKRVFYNIHLVVPAPCEKNQHRTLKIFAKNACRRQNCHLVLQKRHSVLLVFLFEVFLNLSSYRKGNKRRGVYSISSSLGPLRRAHNVVLHHTPQLGCLFINSFTHFKSQTAFQLCATTIEFQSAQNQLCYSI